MNIHIFFWVFFVIFWGYYSGTGKTLFPSALAQELQCPMIHLRLTDVVKGTFGTGEQAVRNAFIEAKSSAPSIVFIDEFQVTYCIYFTTFFWYLLVISQFPK